MKRADRVILKQVGEEALLLDMDRGLLHQLNAAAGFIWERYDTASSAEELARQLAERFDIDQQTALRDVVHTLDRMRQLNLLSLNGNA